jgi:uncharacterized protein (TIGR00661 family)
MNVLYAIQGTGNGHISRAREFIPILKQLVNLDVMVSGTSAEVDPGHPIKFKFPGISYTFGKNGGVDYLDTLLNFQPTAFLNDVMHLDLSSYDLIVNDYEPVTAWACKRAGLPCIGLSHQAAFLSDKTPRPAVKNPATEWLFRYYAPTSSAVGFHYKAYDSFITTPVIRKEVRDLVPVKSNLITVYLPAYSEEILIPFFRQFNDYKWILFSKHSKSVKKLDNIEVFPVNNQLYLKCLEASDGLLCGAGFEAPAEALYLGKRLLVIPMLGQYEQQCNAEALKQFDVSTTQRIDQGFADVLSEWLSKPRPEPIHFPDESHQIIEKILRGAHIGSPRSDFSA